MSEIESGAPVVRSLSHDHAAVATGTSKTDPVGRAPEAGYVSSVRFLPQADITGVNTNTRRLDLVNKGQDGNGSTVIATIQFNSGTNASDFDELAIPINEANDAVAAGDVLALTSAAVGTGLADPGGRLIVDIARQDV